MALIRTADYNGGVPGDPALFGDVDVNADAAGGGGPKTHVLAAFGFTGTGTAVEFDGTGAVKACFQKSIATWAAWCVTGEFRVPAAPTGGGLTIAIASVGATRIGRLSLGVAGSLKLDGTITDDPDISTAFLADGTVIHFMWQGERSSGTQACYLYTEDLSYFETLTNVCGTTTGTLLLEDGVGQADGSGVVQLKNVKEYNSLQTPPSVDPGLVCVPLATAPQVDGWYLKVQTSGMTDVRAKVYEADESNGVPQNPYDLGDFLFTSEEVTVPLIGWSQIHVTDSVVKPFNHYGYQVQGFDGADWIDLGDPGFVWTSWPAMDDVAYDGPAPPLDIAFMGCEQDNRGTQGQTHGHVAGVYLPNMTFWSGDMHYANYPGTSEAKFRELTSDKLRATPGMSLVNRLFVQIRRRLSDHDCADQNGGFGSANNEFAINALLDTSVVPETIPDLGGPIHERGDVLQMFHGRLQILSLGFRNTYRMDPMGADGPTKYAIHPATEDWFCNALLDWHALGGKTLVLDDEEWVGLPQDQGVVGVDDEIKEDHWARYPDQRGRIDAVLSAVEVTCVRGDYHGGAATSKYALADGGGPKHPSACTHFACNGTTNDSGNVRAPDLHNYEQLYKSAADTPDGERINLYTQIHVEDDGSVMTITMRGIDANTGSTVMEMVDVHDGSGHAPYIPPPKRKVVTVDGTPMHFTDATGIGPYVLLDGTSLAMLPAKNVASSVASGVDGVLESDDIDSGPTKLRMPTLILGSTRDDLETNQANLIALWGRQRLRDVQVASDVGRSPSWRAWARQDDAVTPDDDGNTIEMGMAPFCPFGQWRSLVETQWTFDLGENGTGIKTEEIIPLRNNRAPIADSIWRFTGPLKFVDVYDGRTSNGFHWGIPDLDPSLAVGEYLIVYASARTLHPATGERLPAFKAYIVDHDTWDHTEGGVAHTENFFHWGVGGAAITLVPDMVKSVIGVFSTRVRISVEDGVEGLTKVELKAYAAAYDPRDLAGV